ncbi:MAG: epoxyqueuosine reductase QueH [candidate division KSB1 bacterium]|nr:epoxyqueuosine reductase QueH [candidate division KSB1 bacterium]MDZ7391517.1 epoxyqueuosine reductase QueH [candidate division KSB1 bacterium]MDZ7413142.1 epoxyqueuosine reductase QueH [candidate division KSB1 bacterium]
MLSERRSILLLACCAPDATVAIERLKPEWEVVVFFYNPNIHPPAEYELRAQEMRKVAEAMQVELVVGPYDQTAWFEAVRGLEQEPEKGRRCSVCFSMRLEATAREAVRRGIGTFATTLTVSPHKDAGVICALGQEIATRYGVAFLAANFKKQDGFKRSIELSRALGLYRQNYCGCVFSQRGREAR